MGSRVATPGGTPLAPGSRLGPYLIEAALGAGGMGEVWRARDTRLGRLVALKVLPARFAESSGRLARLEREARLLAALNHPHIATLYGYEEGGGTPALVMELVEGAGLAARLEAGPLALGEALELARQIAEALEAAHERGILHRDLKPANVRLTEKGQVKLLDFGLAKALQPLEDWAAKEPSTLTTEESPASGGTGVAGTAPYMSPEQARGEEVDRRSDLWAFGCVLYEMLTGRRAYGGRSQAEAVAAVLEREPDWGALPKGTPAGVVRLLERCLRKRREERLRDAGDARLELEELLREGRGRPGVWEKEESDPGLTAQGVRRPRRRGLWVAVGLVGGLAVATGSLVLWHSRLSAPPASYLVPLTSTPGSENWPTFSPDGDQVAFAWNGERGDNWDIYVKMVGSDEARRLTTEPAVDSRPSWSPDGRQIAFVRCSTGSPGCTIHVVSPLGGADRKVSDKPAVGPLSWSPDSRWLATGAPVNYALIRSDLPRGIRLVDVSSGETRSVTAPTEPTYHSHPALSPDGRRLAYVSCSSGYMNCHLEVCELGPDGAKKGTARRVTRGVCWARAPAWTRDGASLVYGDELSGNRLWRVSIRGDEPPRQIEIAGFNAATPAIAASRDRLAFSHVGSHSQINRFEVGRSAVAVVASSFDDWNPHLSPDGSRIAFESNRGGAGDEIWLAAVDGSNPTQLTHGPGLHQGSPHWSADGRRIAFDSYGENGQWDIWTIDADGGSLRRLTSSPAPHNMPTWSHDGRFIYFSSDRGGTETIWRVPVAGGPEEQVTYTGGGRCEEAADGQTLNFQRATFGDSPLLAVSLTGGQERTVIDCVPRFDYALGLAGIYHVGCGADPRAAPLLLRDTATGADRLLGTLERPAGNGPQGLTVSADGKAILFTEEVGEGSDLMMIENFR